MWSTVVLFVLTFAILGLFLGLAESYDAPINDDQAPTTEEQSRLFDECTSEAGRDGELTEEEYFKCAYDIYD